MASKNTSPEAEQKKLWKLEIKQLEAARKKLDRDTDAEFRKSQKEADAAAKFARSVHAKHLKKATLLIAAAARHRKEIDRRLGILSGRVSA